MDIQIMLERLLFCLKKNLHLAQMMAQLEYGIYSRVHVLEC